MPMMLSAVNVALPSIATALALDAVELSWVPMSFLLTSAALVLSFGRLADMYGRKRVYLLGTTGLIVTSVLATLAPNGTLLIGARLLQAIGAGFRACGVRSLRTLLARDNALVLSFFRSQGLMAAPVIPLEKVLD